MTTAAAAGSEAAGELRPGAVIPAAIAAGALPAADAVEREVSVDMVGRSHAVFRVSVDGAPRFFVKTFGPRRGATDGLAAREAAVLRLAETCPDIAALAPTAWRWDGGRAITATAALAGRPAWMLDEGGGGGRSATDAFRALAEALAAPLAAMHRATRRLARDGSHDDALAPEEPWALTLMDGDGPRELWTMPTCAALLREAAADRALVAELRAARALWRPLCLIHADLKHDNLLVDERPDGSLAVRAIDWEMARIGDPSWDLAALAVRLPLAGDDAPWSTAELEAAAALLRRYAAASGLKAAGLAARLIVYSGALMLATSLQHASTLEPGADPGEARRMLMKARSILRRRKDLTARLAQTAGA